MTGPSHSRHWILPTAVLPVCATALRLSLVVLALVLDSDRMLRPAAAEDFPPDRAEAERIRLKQEAAELKARADEHAKILRLRIEARAAAIVDPEGDDPGREGLAGAERVALAVRVFDQLLFGVQEPGAVTAIHQQLHARLEKKLASVDRYCQLSDPQKQKLELAGRGDIQRLFEGVAAQRRT